MDHVSYKIPRTMKKNENKKEGKHEKRYTRAEN